MSEAATKVVLVQLGWQGANMGDPDRYKMVPEVFANRDAARRYLTKQKITAEKITFLHRQVKT